MVWFKLAVVCLSVPILILCAFILLYVGIEMFRDIFHRRKFVPFVPTGLDVVGQMIRISKMKDGDKVVDLGSGLGHMVFAAARELNVSATGVEINWFLATAGQIINMFVKKKGTVQIVYGDMLTFPLEEYDIVMTFLTSDFMQQNLVQKFENELKKGAKIVSYVFPIQSEQFVEQVFSIDKPGAWGRIYLYIKK